MGDKEDWLGEEWFSDADLDMPPIHGLFSLSSDL
jgi:hypothetical protein